MASQSYHQMIIPEPYILSISLLIICGILFATLVLLHVCRDHGLYNQHREVEGRRQRYQKVQLNLKISQSILLSPQKTEIPDPAVKVQRIPLKAVKFEEIAVCH